MPDRRKYKESFCGFIHWISTKSRYLENLKPCYDSEIFPILERARRESLDFTEFEIQVLEVLVYYCRCYSHKVPVYSKEMRAWKQKDYYLHMKTLIKSGRKIRVGQISLSSTIGDAKMRQFVVELEENNNGR